MIAGRLQLGRFTENFDITRLPSRHDVYLFKLVGRDNSRDNRLFAAAEVRDLTPNVDGDGNLIGLPAVERVVSACADAIRAAQTEHDPKRRMALNRITVYVWPPLDLPVEALDNVAERLTTPTAGLGLEGVEAIGSIVDAGAVERGSSRAEQPTTSSSSSASMPSVAGSSRSTHRRPTRSPAWTATGRT